ncbi:MAG: hypothetical protein KJN63_05040, partial [Acidimicrobiia bacterium]|nr:hypothetical protein [Acidimicrobiia bacterium]
MGRHRVFLTGSGIAAEARTLLIETGCELEQGNPRDTTSDLVDRFMRFAPDAVIVRQGNISHEVLVAAPNLKVISRHGVGTDNIDVTSATQRGIPVTYTPGVNAQSVAEHTVALMLALTRQIPIQDRQLRASGFDKGNYHGVE